MSISSVSSSYVSPLSSIQSTSSGNAVGSSADPDGDGDGGRPHRAHRGGGHMQQAMAQAFQSLGLSLPQNDSTKPSAAGATDSDADSDGSTSGVSNVRQDMHQFTHALFQAVKADSSSAAPTSTQNTSGNGQAGPSDGQNGFAAGLSSLISQVASGNAPAALQDAFTKLTSDLQSGGGTTSSSTTSASGNSSQATLQAFLNKLQENLGYGSSSSSSAAGAILSTQV